MTTPRQSRQAAIPDEPDTTRSLAYWMGRVDANLVELKEAIRGFGLENKARWDDFEEWREEVNQRLEHGKAVFEEHHRRIVSLETVEKKPPEPQPSGHKKFGTWEWFRDGYLEKGIVIVLTVVVLKLIEVIVSHWSAGNFVQ